MDVGEGLNIGEVGRVRSGCSVREGYIVRSGRKVKGWM